MVICHQCSAKNPDSQPLCEQCGASLTRWWAIIQSQSDVQTFYNLQDSPELRQSRIQNISHHCATQTHLVTPPELVATRPSVFADPSRRYRFVKSPTPSYCVSADVEGLSWELNAQVFDLYPEQATVFSQSLPPDPDQAESELSSVKVSSTQIQPYLILQQRLQPAIPVVHDAWQIGGQDILLIEDRWHLPLLQDIALKQSLSPVQILHWLQEMLHLWIELQPLAHCRSVLEVSNIRVDANQRLCLQRLYADPISTDDVAVFALQDLGQLWEQLFQEASFGLQDRVSYDLSAQVSSLIACVSSNMIVSTGDLEIMLGELIQEFYEQRFSEEQLQGGALDTLSMRSTLPGVDPIELQHHEELLKISSWPDKTDPETVPGRIDLLDIDRFSEIAFNLGNEQHPLSVQSLTREDDGDFDAPTTILPMRLSALDIVTLTDEGKQRDHNEDFFSAETQIVETATPNGKLLNAKGLYVLCDGMGGHAGGGVASTLASETLQQFFQHHWETEFPTTETIKLGILSANAAIHSINKQRASSGNGLMGTTVVMALLQNTQLAFTHVGDSRLYRITRKQGLEQLTTDHEVGQREIQRGVNPELAYARPDAYQLTQALGPRDADMVKPDVQTLTIREDSLFLLCSDGLTDNDLVETYWQSHLLPLLSSKANLEQGMQEVVKLANQYNGHDNISVIAIRVKLLPDLTLLSKGSRR